MQKPFLFLWTEAVACAVYCLNRVLSTINTDRTPFEKWYNRKPVVSHLRIFRSKAYVHVPTVERKKLDAKSKPCIFVGYSETQKAYRFWCPEKEKIIFNRDVIFCEEDDLMIPNNFPAAQKKTSDEIAPYTSLQQKENSGVSVPSGDDNHSRTSGSSDHRNPIRLRRQAIPRSSLHALSAEITPIEPLNYEDAISPINALLWKQAMEKEMTALNRIHTWTLTPLPKGRSAIKCRWTFKLKHTVDGSIERYKACLVVKGFSQRPGIDYDQTFSPIVKYDSLRAILAVTAVEDLELFQLDVPIAFLHGELKEEVYLAQPEGHIISRQESQVYRLHKSLYGLKQAS